MDESQRDGSPPGGRCGDVRLDGELMNVLSRGPGKDERPLDELVSRHGAFVATQIRHFNIVGSDIDEVGSMVWEKVWRIAIEGKFDGRRGRDGSDPFLPLLKAICCSASLDFLRREKRRRQRMMGIAGLAELYGEGWREQSASEASQKRRRHDAVPCGVPEQLVEAVAALPPRLRQVYELHAQGLRNREISRRVGCSDGETSRRLKSAREALRRSFGPECGESVGSSWGGAGPGAAPAPR